jgi:DNA-binding GntR family transcriptional regulator
MVSEALRKKILNGEIKAGEPLRQDAIAKSFNVSRIPVREALLQLEAQGLVNFIPHKGAVATELSVSDIGELFELRALIEGEILFQAIDNMTEETLVQAGEILAIYDHALETGTRVENWSELNYEFHSTLYGPANKPLTMEIIEGLNTNSDRYIRLQLLLTDGILKAEDEHRQLLNLCRGRDKHAAVVLLRKHILEAGEAIKQVLLQQNATDK